MTGNGSARIGEEEAQYAKTPVDREALVMVCDAALDGETWWCDLLPHDQGTDHVAFVPDEDGKPTDVVGATWPWEGPVA